MNPFVAIATTAVVASSFFVTRASTIDSKVEVVATGVLVEAPAPSAVVQRGTYILRWDDSRLMAKGADPGLTEQLDALVTSKVPVIVCGTLESKVGEEPLLVISAIDADPDAAATRLRLEFDRDAKVRIQSGDPVDLDKALTMLESIVAELKPFTARAELVVHGECTYAEIDAFVRRVEALGMVVGGVRVRSPR
jgi:hypothetical protein